MSAKVWRDFDAEPKECDGEDDHVPLLVTDPPKVAMSTRVDSLQDAASRLLRAHRPGVSGRYKHGVVWSPSYFAGSCSGAPLSTRAEHICNQREAAPPPRPQGRGVRHGN
jgi:putative transposase